MTLYSIKTPWACAPEAVLQTMGSGPGGLSEAAAEQRLGEAGPNELTEAPRVNPWIRFLAQFKSPVVITLIAAAVISIFIGDAADSLAITAILVLNAVIGYTQEAKADAAIAALQKMSAPRARVVRGGGVRDIAARELCPGDLVVLEAGDFVPADARLVIAHAVQANEASLTGESVPVDKSTETLPPDTGLADRRNMVFAGTNLQAGSARAVIVATGLDTELGRIAGLLSGMEREETPLQQRLRIVGNRLLIFAGGAAALVGALAFYHGESWFNVLLTTVSLAVAAIPEGLPAVVTLALALATRRMARRNAIIRRLPAVETLGETDVICTDKTGTLTTGRMCAREVFAGGKLHAVDESDAAGSASRDDGAVERLVAAAALCSNATLRNGVPTGDSTEVAIIQLAQKFGLDHDELVGRSPRSAEWPFDSARKRMSVAVTVDGRRILYVKGAPETTVPLCVLSGEESASITGMVRTLSARGRRLLAVATRELGDAASGNTDEVEKDLTFLGLISISDPPREEAREAIHRCKEAGIRVVMITGDHPATARSIGRELGIVESDAGEACEDVLTGAQLDRLGPAEWPDAVRKTAVYARVTPEHKLTIVRAFKQAGFVVAMTGDGVNDAPALQEASIGISMGKVGTEVARQASAMVLADDNFATIVSAVEEGRAVFGNIRRTIRYLLTGNTAEILVMLGSAIIGWPLPLLPFHLLWINLVTDGFPTLALAAEPVPPDILQEQPGEFSTGKFYFRILLIGVLVAVLTLGVYAWFLEADGAAKARTMAFTFLVFEELSRSFTSRSDTQTIFKLGIRSNGVHFGAVSAALLLQIAIFQFEVTRKIFNLLPITGHEMLLLAALALIPLSILELRKVWQADRI